MCGKSPLLTLDIDNPEKINDPIKAINEGVIVSVESWDCHETFLLSRSSNFQHINFLAESACMVSKNANFRWEGLKKSYFPDLVHPFIILISFLDNFDVVKL